MLNGLIFRVTYREIRGGRYLLLLQGFFDRQKIMTRFYKVPMFIRRRKKRGRVCAMSRGVVNKSSIARFNKKNSIF